MTDENEQKAIEAAFSQSWDWIERFFLNMTSRKGLAWLIPIHALIAELRKRGYDRQFRAGQSTYILFLSRSCEHGMRLGQSALGFKLKPEGGMAVNYYENNDMVAELEVPSVEITPEIEALLTRLLAQPID